MNITNYEKRKKIGLSLIGIGTGVYLLGLFVFRVVLLTYLYRPNTTINIQLLQNWSFMVGVIIFFIGVPFLDQSLRNRGKERSEYKIIKNYHKIGISLIITGFIILVLGIIGGWIISGYYRGLMSLTSRVGFGLLSALLWFFLLCVGIGIIRTSKNIQKWNKSKVSIISSRIIITIVIVYFILFIPLFPLG
ncbi:MAG: hypothetical protein ACFFAK_10690 [Promethearchaeota archaeon]